MTIDHDAVQKSTSALWSAARRFERNAHLGQPLRSSEVYAWCIEGLATTLPAGAFPRSYTLDQDGLGKARSHLLWLSKHEQIDRARLVGLIEQMVVTIDEATAAAKASR